MCSGQPTSLVKKLLTISDAPHLDTEALIRKLDEVAKTVDLDVSTILTEQMKDSVLGTVRSWIRKNTPPDTKSPEIQQSKALLRFCQEINRFLIEEEGQLFCFNEPSDKLEEGNFRICPLCFYFLHVSVWDTTTKWVDTWEQPKPMPMPRDFTIGLDCLIGYVL